MSDPTQTVPQAVEAERAVLGSVLVDPGALIDLAAVLQPEDFFRGHHQAIYRAMLSLHERREPPDVTLLVGELTARNDLERIGGESYLAELIGSTPHALHAAYYGRQVKSAATLRQLLTASRQAAEAVYANAGDPDKAIDAAQAAVFAVAKQGQGEFAPMDQIMSGYFDEVDAIARGERTSEGVPTGLRDLDRLTGGLHPGDFVVLAGRPGHGKSALAMQIGAHAARQAYAVAVLSLEMSARQLAHRLVSSRAEVDGQRIRTGWVREDEWVKLNRAVGEVATLPLWIDDTPALTILDVRGRVRRLAAQVQRDGRTLGLVIVDYLQLLHAPVKRNESRVQEVGEISRGLKALAKELGVPVLACAQLNRSAESRTGNRPMLADLRESGTIEQDADVVLLLYRESLYSSTAPPNGAELIVAKHRAGPTADIPLYFDPAQTRFADAYGQERPA